MDYTALLNSLMQQDAHIILPCLVGAFVVVNFAIRMVMLAVKLGVMAGLIWLMADLGPQFFL